MTLGLGPPHPALFRGAAAQRTVLENVLVAGPIGQTPVVAQSELGAPPARSDSAIWSEPHAATAQSSDTGPVEQLESCRAVGILSQKVTKQVSPW